MSQTELIKRRSIKVDIVADNGLTWIKVIARNAKAFRHEVMGLEQTWDESDDSEEEDLPTAENSFEHLSIFKKAQEYLTTAKANQVHFCTPQVVFAFMRIPANQDASVEKIMDRLKEMGIVVYLQTPDSSLSSVCQPRMRYENLTSEKVLLDVSSVFALTSELSHFPCEPEKISALPIQVQAEREAAFPCLAQMKTLVKGKQLCMIQSAFERLQEIVKVVGGPREKARFEYLFRGPLGLDVTYDPKLWTLLPSLQVEVIPDAPVPDFFQLLEPPLQKSKLNNGRKIRTQFSPFHALLFGSGGYYRMTTFTAIQWMEKALEDAGIQGRFIVCHEPRSLAEQKIQK
ncbi:hypothetical protein BY458DRAFT_430988 [Sporodiniella umbellata]|nr:hypothetical protein BY458DRAFT_430988 [Sporodiniella umbellata]